MLVLTRKKDDGITIGNGITLTILAIKGWQVRLGINAPDDIRIARTELLEESPDKPKPDRAAPPSSLPRLRFAA